MTNDSLDSEGLNHELQLCLLELHKSGPIRPKILEKLAHIKKFHSEIFRPYEGAILSLMGLFYKTPPPESLIEKIYAIYSSEIREQFDLELTPFQASAYKEIKTHKYFSFSAPTSAGKSYILREILRRHTKDIVIIVPSRALISEFYAEVISIIGREVLVLQFIEDVYREEIERRIYIVTPERAVELFKYNNRFNIGLILMDEAQISEEPIRGLKFDAFFRRAERYFPDAKKVFSHPFVSNPNAQFEKHSISSNAASKNYRQLSVGKIFLSFEDGEFEYFSPYGLSVSSNTEKTDPVAEIIMEGGTALIYTSKLKIYDGRFLTDFAKYIDLCTKIEDESAIIITDELKSYIGASSTSEDRLSTLIQMMERGVVIHHGSMPLKARLLVERFIRLGYAKICLSTSTLAQGINMPFDVVWIDNFMDMKELTLKNLIGRSGRTRKDKQEFDFGYTVIKSANVKTFSERITEEVELTNVSPLDRDLSEIDADYSDIVDAVQNDTFNDDMHLPESQIERIRKADVAPEVTYILDNLMEGTSLKTAEQYYKLTDHFRGKIKKAIKKLYCHHLKRGTLTPAEQAVVSTAIPIMLWHVQGTSFSQIVSMRHSFISKRDQRAAINRAIKSEDITATEGSDQLKALRVRGSPNPFSLPNLKEHRSYIYSTDTSVADIEYDKIVYDTYDYLDKVISQSIADPLCAVFEVYYREIDKDPRALAIQNYIRFGTNEELAIWLLKYGIDPEDIEWLKKHVASVDENNIEFKDSILEEPIERLESVERYI